MELQKGMKKFLPFGTDKMINPAKGEIIYYDDATNEVLCGVWNSKGGQPSKTSAATRFVIIDIDTFCKDESQTDVLNKSVNFTAGLLTKYCYASTSSFFLSKTYPEHTFHSTPQSIINRLC